MKCNRKFESRFRYIEQQVEKDGKDLKNTSLEVMEFHWQAAKSALKAAS